MSDPEQLIAKIERAFADVPYPGDDALVSRPTYGEEPAALQRSFAGKSNWRLLDAAYLNQTLGGRGGALAFFSNRAWQFYLPAYLIADLRGQLDLDRDEPTIRLCAFVTPQSEGVRVAQVWGGGTLGEHARAAFSLLTAAQRVCIVDYLRWKLTAQVVDALTVEQALEHYWLHELP